jgi:hypothetical protein
MTTDKLLLDFLTTDLPLTELARRHGLSLPDLLAWADSPETVRIFDDLQRIAARRSALIATESSAKALGNLAQLSLALAKRAEHSNIPGGSKPPSITALESSRKACATLLRMLPKTGPTRSTGAPPSPRGPNLSVSQHFHSEPAAPPAPRTQATNSTPPLDVLAILAQTTDNSIPELSLSPCHPLTPSPTHLDRPGSLASRAGVIPSTSRRSPLAPLSPLAPRLSPLPSAGIPTG